MGKLKYLSPMLLIRPETGGDIIDDPPSQEDNPLEPTVADTVDPGMTDGE